MKTILVNCAPEETRMAIVESDELLARDFGLNAEPREAKIHRTALLSGGRDLFALIET